MTTTLAVSLRRLAFVVLLSPVMLAAWAQPPAAGTSTMPRKAPASDMQLLTADDIAHYCARLHAASTPQARQAIMRSIHDLMATRATERGGTMRRQFTDGPIRGLRTMEEHWETVCQFASGQSGDAPTGRTADGVDYLTGGIGEDEAQAIRQMASNYSLRLTFTGSQGEYLADVSTEIYGQDGKRRFGAVSEGPFLFVRLPPGQYRVVVTSGGQSRTDTITVPARGSVARTMSWPS